MTHSPSSILRSSRRLDRARAALAGATLLVCSGLGVTGCGAPAPRLYAAHPYWQLGPAPGPARPVGPAVAASPPPAPTSAHPAPVARSEAENVRDKTLASSEALDHVTSLVDDVGPRLAGSEAEPKAVVWAVARMKAIGLSNVHTEPVKEPRWVRGREKAEIVGTSRRALAVTTLGGSVPTPEKGVEAEVLEVASLDELAALPDDKVKGKIVFAHVVMERARDGSGYGKAVGTRTGGASAAGKKGAVAFVVRSIGTAPDRAPHTGALHYIDGVAKIPAAALGVADAELLHRQIAEGKPVKLHLVLTPQELSPADGANVVGEVPGGASASEIVLLGAHLDSWELGMGALDDGAGCAIVLEAARQIALAKTKPRRTVRVVLFANEENGLAGAKAYAKAHEGELPKIVAAAEADFGDGRVYEARLLTDPEHASALGEIAPLLGSLGIQISGESAEGGADVSPLRGLGVPVFDLRQDGTRYFDVHHSENDVVEKIVKADLDQAAASFAAVTYALADRAGGLGRVPEAKRERRW